MCCLYMRHTNLFLQFYGLDVRIVSLSFHFLFDLLEVGTIDLDTSFWTSISGAGKRKPLSVQVQEIVHLGHLNVFWI